MVKFSIRPKCGKRESRRMKRDVRRVMEIITAVRGFKILSKVVAIFEA